MLVGEAEGVNTCKCNLYFKAVYQLQETRATKALGHNQMTTDVV